MGMFVVAPTSSSFHHNDSNQTHDAIISDPQATALGVGVGVIPLLTATSCLAAQHNVNVDEESILNSRNGGNRSIQFWQCDNDNQQAPHGNNFLQSGGNAAAVSEGTRACQDCGNQAKKGCSYQRCRTCCKSRNFDCSTHVKSTWVPAARRRERQLMVTGGAGGSSGSSSLVKKPRLVNSQTTTPSHTSNSNNTPPRSFDTSSSHQDASFREALPGRVKAPAVFKCVRMTPLEDGEDEYAYQATVKINGRVFKGLLYNQGVESKDAYPNISELHLGGATTGGGGKNGGSFTSPILDPSDVYPTSGGRQLGGSSYGNPIN